VDETEEHKVNATELREMTSLLEDAVEQFDAGESYAHHARAPVERALSKLKAALTAKERTDGPATEHRSATRFA